MYNTTNISDANNLFTIIKSINNLSDGLIAIFVLVSLFLLVFMVFKKKEEDTVSVLLACSIITSIVGILMLSVGLIGFNIVIYPIIILFAMVTVFFFS